VADRLGWLVYNRSLTVASALLAIAVLVVTWRRRQALPVSFWPTTLGLVLLGVLAQQLLLVASIENIHYPQYALLALLLGRGGLPLETSWLVATGLGIVDEGYQYLVLRTGTPSYLDWNDIVLNAIGAGLGVVAVVWYWGARRESPLCTIRTAVVAALLCLAAALVIAPPHVVPFFAVTVMGRRYHVLSAAEGMAIMGPIWFGVRSFVRRSTQFTAPEIGS